MMAGIDSSRHLSLIDAGVNNVWSLSLPAHLESLNLHGNHIRHISNLDHLVKLVHLDFSANQISEISGLEKLVNLKTLNLSCNQIVHVDGLHRLRALEHLNLSYNQIQDVTGFLEINRTPGYHLSFVALQGNKISSLVHVIQSLKNVKTLRHLVLSQDGSGNPMCNSHGYEAELYAGLPQLESLNGTDKSGKLSKNAESFSHIPGLEAYLDFLLSSEKDQTSRDPSPQMLITPRIDAVMEQFKQKYGHGGDTSSSPNRSLSSPHSDSGQRTKNMRKILLDKDSSNPSNYSKSRTTRSKTRDLSSGEDSDPVRDDENEQKSSQQKKITNVTSKRFTKSGILKSSRSSKPRGEYSTRRIPARSQE